MPRRIAVVTATLLLATSAALAHDLEAECRVLPGGLVRVEAWYETGDSPPDAKVTVRRADGTVLVEGMLSAQGLFLFRCPEPQDLEVAIEDPRGHKAKVVVAAAALAQAPEVEAPTRRGAATPVKDALLGVAFLLALAAFVLAVRNAERIKRLAR